MTTERWSRWQPPQWWREPGTGRWKKIWTTPEGDIVSAFETPPKGAVWKKDSAFVIVPPTMEEAQRALEDVTFPPERWEGLFGEFFERAEPLPEVPTAALPPSAIPGGAPQQEIGQILETLFPGRVTGVLEEDLRALEQYIRNAPEAFFADIRAIGRTPDTEALLRAIPWEEPFTNEDIDLILGSVIEQEQVQTVLEPEPEWENIRTREVITQSEKDKRYPKGYEGELDEWRLTVETGRNYFHVFKVFGQSLLKLPQQLAASILQASQSFMGASAVDKDWADRFIKLAEEDLNAFAQKTTEEYTGVRLPIPLKDIATLPQSMAFSLTSMRLSPPRQVL